MDVILPYASLFLVDRNWNFEKNNAQPPAHAYHLKEATVDGKQTDIKAMVHQSGRSHNKQDRNSGSSTTKSFEFVITTRPDRAQDLKVRKLVKSYVNSGIKRGPYRRRKTSPSNSLSESECSYSTVGDQISPKCNLTISGASLPLYGNKISSLLTEPRSQSLLNYYLYVVALSWYPLEAYLTYNPVRAGWFSLAIRDEYLFRSILFSSASHLAAESGCYEESTKMLIPIFPYLNQRIQAKSAPSDTIIGIVTCLAMVEISLGNYDKWRIHMTGVKEMVRLRGGLCKVEASLQTKITRSDIEGSSDTMTLPNLQTLPLLSNFVSFSPIPSQGGNLTILNNGSLSPRLRSIFLELDDLTRTLRDATYHKYISLDPRSFDEDIVQTHHDLLNLLLAHTIPTTTTPPDMDLNEAAGCAGLLYAKSLTRPVFSTSTHSRKIINRLTISLSQVHGHCGSKEASHICFPENSMSASYLTLIIWMYFMGGISARGAEIPFFINGLLALAPRICDGKNVQYETWENVKGMLSETLWLPAVHDDLGRTFWGKALDSARQPNGELQYPVISMAGTSIGPNILGAGLHTNTING